jgi:HPt (histidine-containing phosphotransfer) domain-containing protein
MAVTTNAADVADSPVDLAHLKAVTFDDPKLEREVLGLFSERAAAALIAIEQAGGNDERSAAAHQLVGAARAIGATELASVAQGIETAETLTADAVGELARAMAAVIAFLEARMSRPSRQSDAG